MLKNTVDVTRVSKRDLDAQQAIFRLRYHVYNNLLSHDRDDMDHEQKTICDALDSKSSLFLASINSQPVGSIRLTAFDDMTAEENLILKHFKQIPQHYFNQKSALLSNYCILSDYNNTNVTHSLLDTVIRFAMKKKLQRFFAAAPDYLLPYYQHYRFTECSDWCQAEGYSLPLKVMTVELASLITLA